MRKIISILIFINILTLTSLPSHADFKKIDRGHSTWTESTGYWILFVAREYIPGHAFVVWAVRDRKKNTWKNSSAFGMYPLDTKRASFGRNVKGQLIRESLDSINNVNNGVAVAVTKKMFDYTKMNADAISTYPTEYNLIKINCVHFTDTVARAIGLKTPNIENYKIHPQGYINALKNINN